MDDFAWSAAKSTLVVGYLGAKIDKVQESPPHQVVLFKREKDSKVRRLFVPSARAPVADVSCYFAGCKLARRYAAQGQAACRRWNHCHG